MNPASLCSLDPLHGPSVAVIAGEPLCEACRRSWDAWLDRRRAASEVPEAEVAS